MVGQTVLVISVTYKNPQQISVKRRAEMRRLNMYGMASQSTNNNVRRTGVQLFDKWLLECHKALLAVVSTILFRETKSCGATDSVQVYFIHKPALKRQRLTVSYVC